MERRKTSASRSTSTASTASYAAPESAQGRITGFTTSLLVPGKIALEILSGGTDYAGVVKQMPLSQ
jgi:hypothetical protein